MTRRLRIPLVIVGIPLAVVAPRPADAQPAQNYPGAALIENAARQMNAVTPPTMPEQVITIGSFDGATGRFNFVLPDTYPPNIPPAKWKENGGPVEPEHVANIGSYNVVYAFNIKNKPSGFAMTLTVHGARGDSTAVPATIDPTGTRATVRFRAQSFARQTLRIQKPVRDTVVFVTPHLRDELGAFVVPYLLVGIVYEPPGAGSTANYSQTKTVNTVMSWSAAETAGIVQTIDPNKLYDMVNKQIGAGLDKLQPGAGTVWTTVAGLADQPTVTKTLSATTSTGQSTGFSISVSVGFTTALHQYPGNGDLFIVLHDVLFAYLAANDKVTLAPLMYAGSPDYMSAAELDQRLPAKTAASFKAMDPHFGKATIASAGAPIRGAVFLAGGELRSHPRLVPFEPTSWACKHDGSPVINLTQGNFNSTVSSQTQSETDVTHNTGLMASILGGGDSSHTTTYTTSHQQTDGEAQSTTITLLCAGNDEFWVDLYLDDVFRTFYTLRGDPLSSAAPIMGMLQAADGRALASQPVRLHVGDRSYVTVTDKQGNFAFPLRAAPNGPATITAGNEHYSLTLTGAPRNVLLKAGAITDRR